MSTLQVFDPAMCCSTGVCGPDIDPKLMRFAADLEWLAEQGVTVERFNLAQQPEAFAALPAVRQALEAAGEAALPVLIADGRPVASGLYPTRSQLGGWFGKKPTVRFVAEEVPAKGSRAASSCCGGDCAEDEDDDELVVAGTGGGGGCKTGCC